MHSMEPRVSDSQWAAMERHLYARPKRPFLRRERKGGRPPVSDRCCFDALLRLVLLRGTWRGIPRNMGHWTTIYRRIMRWHTRGELDLIWRAYLRSLRPVELAQIGPLVDTRTHTRPQWWFTLDYIYRLEFGQPARPDIASLVTAGSLDELRQLFGELDWEE